ncbi:hypothetical protein AB833_29115 [Chromatiales bacterium (ex Bugula neritina AB1)]|nr:hypothetical protein AB833_29115 [Chromatiales bacterium (ex Bugula neritina AB1)]
MLAVCVEPIQGEGGIRVLDQSYLQAIQQCSDSHDFPLIVDEIQSGMGRTGRFLASDHTNVYGDYLTLSKSLGGGLVKIGAMLVKKSLYIDDFGYLHSSTFADDALSAIVASHTLKVLQRDDASLIKTCESRGNYIRNRLDELREKYPEFIDEVRGRGLMIGIEFKKPTGIQSLLAREIYDQELFGFFISGYLLNQYHIRVVPTLSSPNTLRLEPSAYIDETLIDEWVKALDQTLDLVKTEQWSKLCATVFGYSSSAPVSPSNKCPLPAITPSLRPVKVACVAHFIEAEHIVDWDPLIGGLGAVDAEMLLDKAYNVVDPFVTQNLVIEGKNRAVEMQIYGIPVSTAGLVKRIQAGQSAELLQQVKDCVDSASKWGAQLVGFAGHTSIITNNCQLLRFPELGLTSGNSLTAAAAINAIHQSTEKGIDLRSMRLGVVGAVGNIGEVITKLLASDVGAVHLFGSERSHRRLSRLKDRLSKLTHKDIVVESNLSGLKECDVIFTATNSPDPIITEDVLADSPVVICDIAVPGDVNVCSLPANVTLIRGGVISLPASQSTKLFGSGLQEGELWACVAEVLLLGLEGWSGNYSYGALDPQRVTDMLALAKKHDFNLRPRYVQQTRLSENDVASV